MSRFQKDPKIQSLLLNLWIFLSLSAYLAFFLLPKFLSSGIR